MSPEEELIRAGEARQIIDSRMFQEACQRISESLAAQRRQVPMSNTDMHTRLILTEQLWGNINDWLMQAVETGKFAEFSLKQKRDIADRMRAAVSTLRG
jgi:hypothetical protein